MPTCEASLPLSHALYTYVASQLVVYIPEGCGRPQQVRHPLSPTVHLRPVKTKTSKEKYLMTRVKRGTVARKRRNKILELNRGFRGSHSTLFRTANQRSLKALSSSYSDRRKKKRQYRRLWIRRINAGSRSMGVTYSCFIHDLKDNTIPLNRKMLSQLLILHPKSFQNLTLNALLISKTKLLN